jgi:endoglucanase Acf2
MSKENIEKLESALGRLETKENVIYFLTYDTKNNARAAIKHIYDMALTLKENGHTPKT